MATAVDSTTGDLIRAVIGRQVEECEVMTLGIAAPPASAGRPPAQLASVRVLFTSFAGLALCLDSAPLGLTLTALLRLGQAHFLFHPPAAATRHPQRR
jgi:hypothetical protein